MSSKPSGNRNQFVIGVVVILLLGAGFVVWQRSGVRSGEPVADQPGGGTTVPEVAIYQRLCKGKELAGEGRHAEALAVFEEVVRESTNASYKWDADIQAALAIANLKQIPDALKRLDRIIAECPLPEELPSAQMAKAEVLSLEGRSEAAIQILDELVRTHTDVWPRICEEALVAKAAAHQRFGQTGLTRVTLDRIILDYPGSEDAQRSWAEKQVKSLTDKHQAAQAERVRKMTAENAILLDKIGNGETVLTASRPYVITDLLTVADGATLRMEPGVRIQFGVCGGIAVEGRIEATGTPERQITMEPLGGDPDRDWWLGIRYQPAEHGSVCRLSHCRMAGAETALETTGGAAELSDCVFDRCGRVSIKVGKGSRVAMRSCNIEQARRVGVEAESSSVLVMDECVIKAATSHGLMLQGTGKETRIHRTKISDCGRDGILLRNRCSPVISDCQLQGNLVNGIEALDGASPVVTATVCTENGKHGILVKDKVQLSVESCAFVGNRHSGFVAEGRCSGRITSNRMDRNEEHGLVLRLDCDPEVTLNSFAGNGQLGVLLQNSQPAVFKNNAFEKNGTAALRNEGPGRIRAGENWWGTADEKGIKTAIQDRTVNGEWGEIDYAPWLSSPPVSQMLKERS